jgi:secreted trypsin-like serine protease
MPSLCFSVSLQRRKEVNKGYAPIADYSTRLYKKIAQSSMCSVIKMNSTCLVLVLLLAVIFDVKVEAKFDRSECKDPSKIGGLVVGGKVTSRDEWPWIVALFLVSTQKIHGAGSLVSERFVLTAAQLLHSKNETNSMKPEDLIAYLGKWSLSDSTDENVVAATIEKFFIHGDWNFTDTRYEADIALIKLTDDVKLTNKIRSVCLWTPGMKAMAWNDGGFVVGW